VNTVAIIQARMGSERLPGKVMMYIEGWPMLARVVKRAQLAKQIDIVVVATTTLKEDDCVADFVTNRLCECYRPDRHSDDVLGRYADTAKAYCADVVVRITADCPLIDPDIVDHVVKSQKRIAKRYIPYHTYVSNCLYDRTYPRGVDVEVFDVELLSKANEEATLDYQRVHVTPFIIEDAATIKHCLRAPVSHTRPDVRLCVDEQKDLDLVRAIYSHFGNREFDLLQVLGFLDDNPAIRDLNKEVVQKAVQEL